MKIIKGIGITILVLVLLIASFVVWTWQKSEQYKDTAVPYMVKAIHDISDWDMEVMKSYMDPKPFEKVSDADLKKLVNMMSKMGKILQLEEPQFLSISSQNSTDTGSNTFVKYRVPAKYEKGNATINITLKEIDDDKFIIYKFNLDSLALI